MSGNRKLTVNGEAKAVQAEGETPLLLVLRNELGLKGTRFGCGLEQCGACMVLIEGEPRFSCAMSVADAAGKSITTIEGLSPPDELDPLRQAFIDEQAGQCGYCLSGIVVSASALLRRNPRPSRDQIVAALDKHLCRCGSQPRIVRAIERAAKVQQAQ
jgi:aerobic-type carbon monoxide dehydrogenase small subunit (CoxS/CutS family)